MSLRKSIPFLLNKINDGLSDGLLLLCYRVTFDSGLLLHINIPFYA